MDAERTILLVEQDREISDTLGRWLDRHGYQLLACPGPQPPTYSCIGVDRGSCPLAHGADLVVLDMWLAGESVMVGASSLELLERYLDAVLPVIAFTHGADPTDISRTERLTVIEWPPDQGELLQTTRSLIGTDAS